VGVGVNSRPAGVDRDIGRIARRELLQSAGVGIEETDHTRKIVIPSEVEGSRREAYR
jgi:hypothetical protein